MRKLTLAFLLVVAPLASPADEPLGRLFTTPEQRRALDAGRIPGDASEEPAAVTPSGPEPVDGQVVVNGVIRRSGGPDVVWVNGSPAGAQGRIRLRRGPDRSGRVILEDAAMGVTARLKAGQFWERANGRVDECRGCGRPSAPAEPATSAPAPAAPAADAPAAAAEDQAAPPTPAAAAPTVANASGAP